MQLDVLQAERARDSLMKTIYSHLHEWVMGQINRRIEPICIKHTPRYIGTLDMPGFGKYKLFYHRFQIFHYAHVYKFISKFIECFESNSFEQLMINYGNESIQDFCLKNVMKRNITSNQNAVLGIVASIFNNKFDKCHVIHNFSYSYRFD